jgi:hypothetical protein
MTWVLVFGLALVAVAFYMSKSALNNTNVVSQTNTQTNNQNLAGASQDPGDALLSFFQKAAHIAMLAL